MFHPFLFLLLVNFHINYSLIFSFFYDLKKSAILETEIVFITFLAIEQLIIISTKYSVTGMELEIK